MSGEVLDSELEMELYGTTPGSCEATAGMGCHDKLIFENIIDLGTSSGLKVTLLGGYLPGAGDSYDLFDWGSQLSGAFGYLNLPTLDPSLFWDTSQLYTEGVLSVRAVPLPGAIWLFAAAVGLLGLMRRSRQTRLLPTPA